MVGILLVATLVTFSWWTCCAARAEAAGLALAGGAGLATVAEPAPAGRPVLLPNHTGSRSSPEGRIRWGVDAFVLYSMACRSRWSWPARRHRQGSAAFPRWRQGAAADDPGGAGRPGHGDQPGRPARAGACWPREGDNWVWRWKPMPWARRRPDEDGREGDALDPLRAGPAEGIRRPVRFPQAAWASRWRTAAPLSGRAAAPGRADLAGVRAELPPRRGIGEARRCQKRC